MTPENPLWRYALELYAAPDIESVCLRLQAQGAGVNALLLACWAGQQGVRLGAEQWKQLLADPWREQVLSPLRRLRYRVRERREQAPALDASYQALKQAELACEQAELMLLHDRVSAISWPLTGQVPAATLMGDNLAGYCDHEGVAPDAELLDALVRAALHMPETG